jgi:hypothetical protein
MGEAKRRKATLQEWANERGPNSHIMLVRDLPEFVQDVVLGESQYIADGVISRSQLITGLLGWLHDIRTQEPGKNALCLACDHEFTREQRPVAVFVTTSYRLEGPRPQEIFIFTGVCPTCAQKTDAELTRILSDGLGTRNPQFGGFTQAPDQVQ